MKRSDIEVKIKEAIDIGFIPSYMLEAVTSDLTDLFIQLSTERCLEQREICVNTLKLMNVPNYVHKHVLLAPLPALD